MVKLLAEFDILHFEKHNQRVTITKRNNEREPGRNDIQTKISPDRKTISF